MRVSYVSDLHMEMGIPGLNLPGGDVLLLAGDLIQETSIRPNRHGLTWDEFFEHEASKYENVFYVLGNHEHYCGNISLTKDKIDQLLSKYPKVRVLENGTVKLGDFHLFGATLWTDYADNRSNAKDSARICMNDHRLIAINRMAGDTKTVGTFKPEDAYDRNQESRHILMRQVEAYQNFNWIILTHHTPSMNSGHARWGGSQNWLNFAFHNTGLDRWIEEHPNIKVWVHGHTHDSCDYKIGQTRILCNPKGYGKENRHFDFLKTFDL